MAALLCTPQQEVLNDAAFPHHRGYTMFPQCPPQPRPTAPTGGDDEDDSFKPGSTDYDLQRAQEDLVDAALAMDVLPRIRYLLEVGVNVGRSCRKLRSPASLNQVARLEDASLEMLDILTRVCHHSLTA